MKNHQNLCFRPKVTFEKKKKGPCQEACKQSSGVGKNPQMVAFSKFGNWLIQNYLFKCYPLFYLLLVFIGNGGFGASPLRTTVCRLPGRVFFFCWKSLFGKNRIFSDFSIIVHQNDPKMIPKKRIIARTGILDPIEFWWVP